MWGSADFQAALCCRLCPTGCWERWIKRNVSQEMYKSVKGASRPSPVDSVSTTEVAGWVRQVPGRRVRLRFLSAKSWWLAFLSTRSLGAGATAAAELVLQTATWGGEAVTNSLGLRSKEMPRVPTSFWNSKASSCPLHPARASRPAQMPT